MNKDFKIYLIDDDPIEVLKLERVMKTLNFNCEFEHFSFGNDAITRLSDEYKKKIIILLDLNMSKLSGIEILKIIKKEISLKKIPVVILSTSNNVRDISECYKYGAAGYLVKPLRYEDYLSKIQCLFHYWAINEFA